MRYIQLLLVGCVAILLLVGCSKLVPGGSNSGTSSTDLLVQSVVTINYDTANSGQYYQTDIDYQYNNNQKSTVSETMSNTFNGQTTTFSESITFSYSSGLITETGESDINNVTAQETIKYYINSAGNEMDSIITGEVSGGVTVLTEKQVYSYNGSGYCGGYSINESLPGDPNQTGTIVYTYSGKDVVRADYNGVAEGMPISTTTTYTYNGQTGNVDAEPVSFLPIFFNKTFDLPSSATLSAAGISHTEEYTYSIDSKDRVTAITGTTASGKQLLQETITYEN